MPKTRTGRDGQATGGEGERLAPRWPGPTYVLRLYVAGLTARSVEAVETTKAVCEEYLAGRYKLEVIDLCQHPDLARGDRITALPTLVKKRPSPLRRLVGRLSDKEHILVGLDLAQG